MEPTVYKVKSHKPAARSRRPRSSREPLDLYFDQARRYPRLSAAQERTALVRLVELRRERWAALVSLPALRPAVLAIAEAAGQTSREIDETHEVVETGAELRSPAANDAAAASEAALVARLESLDVDGTVAERLVDAVAAVARGVAQDDLPAAQLAGVGADELARYYDRVRRAADRYLRARNRFVCSNLRLVAMVADRYSGRSMALADRVQEGNLGLIKAVERFDPNHGTRFSTYAVWWIRHAITRALVDRGRTVRIPAHLHAIFTKVRAVRTELEGRLGRPARLSELAEAVELPVSKVRVAIEAMSLRAVALDASDNDDDQPSWGDRLGTPAPQAEIDAQLDACRNETLACRALANLGVMERHILERRFELHGMPRMTLEALGQHYHLSRERIRQIQNRALAAIRQEVETSPVGGLAFA
jgi:RNA polymerase primary sigma factor